jgi:uncharacterized protein YdhG (YjbR/CyaY superfamily)
VPAKPASMTVAQYLASLPDDRRAELERVRDVVRKRLPPGYEEGIGYGMIYYSVPLSVYPDTYNKQPLGYVALASQKNYLALHLVPVYGDKAQEQRLRDGFAAKGKRLDMGKACIRFRRADDLDLDTIGDIVASVPMARWVEIAKSARRR